jgi:hypothetical protein
MLLEHVASRARVGPLGSISYHLAMQLPAILATRAYVLGRLTQSGRDRVRSIACRVWVKLLSMWFAQFRAGLR